MPPMHSGFVGFVVAAAITAAMGANELREPLRPLEFLVGSCWTGTFPDGKSTDTHCFESVFDGHFVRDRHHVRGASKPYAGEAIYGWDAKRKKVVYTYWASDGALSTGEMILGAAGELIFPEAYAADGGEMTLKNVWTRRGPEAYDVWVARRTDGEWRELWRMTLRREQGSVNPR